MKFKYDVIVVGEAGHVGLPLAIAFAQKGKKVAIYDINEKAIETIKSGKMPFKEKGAEEALRKVLNKNKLHLFTEKSVISEAEFVVVIIGTPVDEHLNPKYSLMKKFFMELLPFLRDNQVIILRSTVFPGTSKHIQELMKENGKKIGISFCPERIAEGKALEELFSLPQIVSAFDANTLKRVENLFSSLGVKTLRLEPLEAELSKLNVWRYITFAVSNQFYMIANDYGVDFYRIYEAMTNDYPRLKGMPRPGFAAGPCLFKDTMQLGAFNNSKFFLGYIAMFVNEGLPDYVVSKLKEKYDLKSKTVGILGMAFKAESDDPRESLSFKLKKILEFEAKQVLCSDEYIKSPEFLKPEEVINLSDIIIIATPHQKYKHLNYGNKVVVDVWNHLGKGGLI